MSLEQFISKSRRRYDAHGPSVLPSIGQDFAVSAATRLTQQVPMGTNVFDRDWDVLVILDGCRHDMYEREVRECDSIWSLGGASNEWMQRTFGGADPDDLAETAYVTANPFSTRGPTFDEVDVGLLDEVWKDSWDDDLGTTPPRPVTDRGIAACRDGDFDRVIVHYMQPHYPFIHPDTPVLGRMDRETFGEMGDEPPLWDQVQFGMVDRDEALAAYDANLRHVWDDVELLLENVDGTVAVTADHGNALGEWGQWGHRPGLPLPALRRVPWDVRQARDERTHTLASKHARKNDTADAAVEDRLEALGYA